MGFWHTGYEEHHQVSSFWNSDESVNLCIEYKCEQCAESFNRLDLLVEHRFSAHPYETPTLLIRGKEAGSLPININTPLAPNEIAILNAVNSKINGSQVDLESVTLHLSKVQQENIDLILSNNELSSCYKLRFNISSYEDLLGVETEFLRLVQGRVLSISVINEFILKTLDYKSAANYVDGLCEYFYGVLAKEESEGSSLKPYKYREKFNRSAEELSDYSRTLANYIKGLIAFHFNHFAEAKSLLNDGNLFKISCFFDQIFSGNDVDFDGYLLAESQSLENMLIDEETNLVLNVFRNSNPSRADFISLEQGLRSTRVSEFGKVKLKILKVKLLIKYNDEKQAIPILKDLKSLTYIELWVSQVMKKISSQ